MSARTPNGACLLSIGAAKAIAISRTIVGWARAWSSICTGKLGVRELSHRPVSAGGQ